MTSGRPRTAAGVAAIGVAVLGLHLALIWLLLASNNGGRRTTPDTAPDGPRRITLRLLPRPEPQAVATATLTPPAVPVATEPARRNPRRPVARPSKQPSEASSERPAEVPTDAARPSDATAAPAVASRTEPASSAPSTAEPSLLDTEAIRRAIRASARDSGSAAQQAALAAGRQTDPSVQARMGQAIGSTAHGDCLKGEYAGAGMGPLSLPFLAAAALGGKCAR